MSDDKATGKSTRPWLSLVVLLVLMSVALALRWRYVRDISLFVDEFVTAWAARAVLAHGLPIFPSGDFYPHGLTFTYLEAPFVSGAFDEHLARVPAVFISLLMLPAVYWVGRQMLSETASLVAVAALAVDPEAIIWGARARMYGLLQLLVLLAICFFYRGLATDRPRDRVISMTLLAAAILTHAEAIFLLPILGLAALVYWPWRRLLRWSVILPFGIGAAGALVYYLLAKFGQPGHLETLQDSRPYLAMGIETLLTGPRLFAPVFLRLYRLPFTLLALAGLVYLVPPRWDRRAPLTYLYVILLAFSALLILLAGATWQNERYFFMMLPLLFLIAGEVLYRFVVAALPRARPAGRWLAPLAAVAVALFVGLVGSRHAYVQVWGYDQAWRALRDQFRPGAGDRVVTPMPASAALYGEPADYFMIQSGYQEFLVPRPGDGVPVDLWTATPAMTTTTGLAELLATAPRTWFVVDGWRLQTRYDPDLIQLVADQMVKEYDQRGVMILRADGYAPPPEPAVERERTVDVGQLELTGFGLSSGRPQPGSELEVTLNWQKTDQAKPAYTTFLHLVSADGTGVAGVDEPLLGGLFQPNLWPDGQTFADRHRMVLPAGLPAGRYRLDLGLYEPTEPDEESRVTLTYVTVGEPPAVSPPTQPLSVTFGDAIRLEGSDLRCDQAATPLSCHLTLHWRAAAMMDHDYTVFAHLVGPEGQIADQHDQPAGGAFYPTSAWLPGDEIVTEHTLRLPAGAVREGYSLEVGLYDPVTDARLPAVSPAGRAMGDTVDVPLLP